MSALVRLFHCFLIIAESARSSKDRYSGLPWAVGGKRRARLILFIVLTCGAHTSIYAANIRAPIQSWSYTCGVPGEYTSGDEVCAARAAIINWPLPVVFDASLANQPGYDGTCVSVRSDGRVDKLAFPFNGYYCPYGYLPRSYAFRNNCFVPWTHFKGDAAWCQRLGLDPQKNLGKCAGAGCCIGNPVHAYTGNKYQAEIDIGRLGGGISGFTRYYNSKQQYDNTILHKPLMGYGWRHSFMARIRLDANPTISTATIERPNGKSVFYTLTDGVWVGDSDLVSSLE